MVELGDVVAAVPVPASRLVCEQAGQSLVLACSDVGCPDAIGVAVDESVMLLEGEWPFGRTVVIEFPTMDALRAWYDSPEYRRILKHRMAASQSNAAAVRGRQ